jgi:hypothetical protein
MASLKGSEEIKFIDYKMFGGALVERSAVIDNDPIVKRKNGVVVSFSSIGEDFSGIRLIIENPENVEGIIVGTLEIPFPKDGDNKILVIPNIIELRLFNGTQQSTLATASSGGGGGGASSHYKHQQTFADRLKISSIYESRSDRPFTTQNKINPNLVETLMNVVKVCKLEIKKRICSNHESTSTNCILQAINSSSHDYFICGQCRKFLASKDDYKCNRCMDPVFIDSKGNAKNKLCNKCSNS